MADRPRGYGRRSQRGLEDGANSDSYAKFHGIVHRGPLAVLNNATVAVLKLIWKFPPKNSDHLYKMPPKSRTEQSRQVAMFQIAEGEGSCICDPFS
jgi:hypothetical protein